MLAASSELSGVPAAIQLDGLVRKYDGRVVVGPLNLRVESGECFGLLGPNGAGKSTTLKMLTTLLPPSEGQAIVGGARLSDVAAVRAQIGVVFQAPSLDLRLSSFENLDFYLALHRPALPRAQRHMRVVRGLDQMGLAERAREEVGRLSWGLRRRVEIARALLTEPSLLVLDEPTTGLDPQTRFSLWEHLMDQRRARTLTLIVATHDMEEAARCDRLAVMAEGKIVAVNSPAGLCESTGEPDLGRAFLSLTGTNVANPAASAKERFKAKAGTVQTRE